MKLHNKLLPKTGHDKPDFMPKEWYKYTTLDIDESVLPKAVRAGLEEYKSGKNTPNKCMINTKKKMKQLKL